jgi:hypothetical protein
MDIQEGWSIISVPGVGGGAPGTASVSEIESQCSPAADRVTWRHRADASPKYTEPDEIASSAGVYVNLESPCEFETSVEEEPPEKPSYTSFSEAGWYTVSVSEPTSISSVSGSCSFRVHNGYGGGPGTVLEAASGGFQSLSSDAELSPKKGYWVYAESACQMGSSTGPSGPQAR